MTNDEPKIKSGLPLKVVIVSAALLIALPQLLEYIDYRKAMAICIDANMEPSAYFRPTRDQAYEFCYKKLKSDGK